MEVRRGPCLEEAGQVRQETVAGGLLASIHTSVSKTHTLRCFEWYTTYLYTVFPYTVTLSVGIVPCGTDNSLPPAHRHTGSHQTGETTDTEFYYFML